MTKHKRSSPLAPLFRWQTRAVTEFFKGLRVLAFPYGSGKAPAALQIARDIAPEAACPIFLVICGKRNVLTWSIEIRKWFGEDANILTHEYFRTHDAYSLATEGGRTFLLITHDRVVSLIDHLHRVAAHQRCALVVYDETTAIKNHHTKRTKAALLISEKAELHGVPCLALTGKIAPEHPKEVFTQLLFAYGSRSYFGSDYHRFTRKWFLKTNFDYVLRHEKANEFWASVANHIITLTGEEHLAFQKRLGIDRREYIIEQYEESAQQRLVLDNLEKTWSLPANNFRCQVCGAEYETAMTGCPACGGSPVVQQTDEYTFTMSLLAKRQEIASGFYYDAEHRVVRLLTNPKASLLQEVLRDLIDAGHKRVVVWYKFTEEIEAILNMAHDANAHAETLNDPDALTRFAYGYEGEVRPMVGVVPIKAGRGLNELTSASVDIFYSNEYSNELREQCEKRIDRLGQRSSHVMHIDLCSPRQMDAEIVLALQAKDLTKDRLRSIVRSRKEGK